MEKYYRTTGGNGQPYYESDIPQAPLMPREMYEDAPVAPQRPPRIEELRITSISDLHMYGKGAIVRLPDFAEGQPFVARLRRPSMLVLAKQGKIPNTLLASANTLFAKGGAGADIDNPKMMADMYDVMEVIARAALMEPTYDEIRECDVTLSDQQMMAIFSYTQNGIEALGSFRTE